MRIVSIKTALSVGILSIIMSGCADLSNFKLPTLPSIGNSQTSSSSTDGYMKIPAPNYPGFDKSWTEDTMTMKKCHAYEKFKSEYRKKIWHNEQRFEEFVTDPQLEILDSTCTGIIMDKFNKGYNQ